MVSTLLATSSKRGQILLVMLMLSGLAFWSGSAPAMPVFARQYDMSCAACHAAFPRLNAFGEQFRSGRRPDCTSRKGNAG